VTALELRSLAKRYGKTVALDGVSLSIPGGAVGLLGPNGAGKSTLLKILLGFVHPDEGEALVFGTEVRRSASTAREAIGYMPENESFVPGMSAVEFVRLVGRLSGLPAYDSMQRTHMVLDYVGLGEERYRTLETFSTGMKQKVKFATALVHHPRILLLDEPTAGLDPRGRGEMLSLIRDVVRKSGIDVILSSHILPDVEGVCDRIVILDRGRVVADGPIDRLTASPEERWEVQVRGDFGAFSRALVAKGLMPSPIDEGTLDLACPGGTEPILRAAASSGVQLRHLSRARGSLEDLFSRLIPR